MSIYQPIKKGQYVYKREGKFKTSYKVRFKQNGVFIEERFDADSDKDALNKGRIRIAQALDENQRQEITKQEIKSASPLVRWDTLMDQIIESKSNASTRKTVKFYLKRCVLPVLEKRCPYVKDFPLTGCEDFISWYQTDRPGQRVFNARKYFLQVLNRAKKLKLLDPDLHIKMPNPDSKSKPGKVYSDHELSALLKKAKPLLTLQILMALTMGMRRSEILKLKWDRINWERQTIALKPEDTKIKRAREFKVNSHVWQLLIKRRRLIDSEYVFPSPTNELKPIQDNKSAWQACKRAAKVKGRFHDLRHTFLTVEVSRKKHQAMDVCEYAGLSIEELRETYLHPDYVDTAYLADDQDKRIASIMQIESEIGHKIGHEAERLCNV